MSAAAGVVGLLAPGAVAPRGALGIDLLRDQGRAPPNCGRPPPSTVPPTSARTILVTEAGVYDVEARVASESTGGAFYVEMGGVDATVRSPSPLPVAGRPLPIWVAP